jgi:hypothetical protein
MLAKPKQRRLREAARLRLPQDASGERSGPACKPARLRAGPPFRAASANSERLPALPSHRYPCDSCDSCDSWDGRTHRKIGPAQSRGGAMRGLTARTRNRPSLGGDRERLSPGYALPTKPSEPSCDIAMSAAPQPFLLTTLAVRTTEPCHDFHTGRHTAGLFCL